MGFKTYMTFEHQQPSTNALVFATREEAHSYGQDLFMRWMQPTGYEVREHPELEPTDQWVEGEGLKKIGSDLSARMPAKRVVL